MVWFKGERSLDMNYFLFIGVVLLLLALFFKPTWVYIVLSLVAFGLFFEVYKGAYINYAIFILGVILLVVELYIPGFGIAGVLGTIVSITSLYLHTSDPVVVVLLVAFSLVSALMTALISFKLGKNIRISPGLVLDTELNLMNGFRANRDFSFLMGLKGKTLTDLRPVGRAEFEGEIFDVISDLDMIPSDTQVLVKHVEGSKIIVRKENTL